MSINLSHLKKLITTMIPILIAQVSTVGMNFMDSTMSGHVSANDLAGVSIGAMIELPRAAMTAEDLAEEADFFSFGTNDLTQMGFGFSRDDVESAFIPQYLSKKILKSNPFETLDPGIAKLVKLGVEGGHEANDKIVCGVCGETGGDPDSIQMYYDLGLDYVSCSPFRVPIARLAAAQAKIKSNGGAR